MTDTYKERATMAETIIAPTDLSERERYAQVLGEALAQPGAGPVGDSRKPVFGEWLRGIWAGDKNPHRDGQYVRTIRRTGRFNPGTFYELTNGRGAFWEYPAESTVFILPPSPESKP
jgi:hypothetical protein